MLSDPNRNWNAIPSSDDLLGSSWDARKSIHMLKIEPKLAHGAGCGVGPGLNFGEYRNAYAAPHAVILSNTIKGDQKQSNNGTTLHQSRRPFTAIISNIIRCRTSYPSDLHEFARLQAELPAHPLSSRLFSHQRLCSAIGELDRRQDLRSMLGGKRISHELPCQTYNTWRESGLQAHLQLFDHWCGYPSS